jgi:hypothetical protein
MPPQGLPQGFVPDASHAATALPTGFVPDSQKTAAPAPTKMGPGSYQTAPGAPVQQAQADPRENLIQTFGHSFERSLGMDPEKIMSKGNVLTAELEAGKEAVSSFGRSVEDEWKQPTVGGPMGKSIPLPPDQALAARILFPFHLIARGAEGIAGGLERGSADIAQGSPQSIAQGLGEVFGTKTQFELPSQVVDHVFSPLVKRGLSINDGQTRAVNQGITGQLLKAQASADAEVARHAQAIQSASSRYGAETGNNTPLNAADAVKDTRENVKKIRGTEIYNSGRHVDLINEGEGGLSWERAKDIRTEVGNIASKMERAGQARVAAPLWTYYNGLTNAMRDHAAMLDDHYSAGKQFQNSFDQYNKVFSVFQGMKKGLYGDLTEPGPGGWHAEVARKIGDPQQFAKVETEWNQMIDNAKKYGADPDVLNRTRQLLSTLEENKTRAGADFAGKLRLLAKHPYVGLPAVIGADVGLRTMGVGGLGIGFVIPLIIAGKMMGYLDNRTVTGVLKEIQKTYKEPGAGRVIPEVPGPMQPPIGGGAAPAAPGGWKGGINPRGVEASTAPRPPEADIQSHTAEIERLQKIVDSDTATDEEKHIAQSQLEAHEDLRDTLQSRAAKVKSARGSRAQSGVYRGRR